VKVFALMVLTLLTGLTGLTMGATVKLAWNANPEPDVVRYELKAWQVVGTHELRVETTETTAVMSGLTAEVPYFFAVRAVNAAGLMSDYCAAILWTPVARMRLVMQVSNDAKAWADVAETARVMEPREFYRVKMEVEP
jgi:hypothetical protein